MKNLKITIPEPCHEDWSKMTKTNKGKFCNSCTKEVFDFTTFSDEQLIKQFGKQGDLCGRFTTNQLDRSLVLQRKKQHNYLSYAFSGIFSLLLLNSSPSKAQEKPKTIQTNKKFISIPLQNTRVTNNITVTGKVLDEANLPLPGATVLIKGTLNGTTTDFDGVFSLDCKKTDILVFSYVGYFEQEFPVKKAIHVNLALDKSLRDVVVTSLGFVKKKYEINTKLKPNNSLEEIKVVAGGISVKDCSSNSKKLNDSFIASGTIVDETNMPFPEVTVLIKGTNQSVNTDFNGKFSINCRKNDTLIITYTGYKTIEKLIIKKQEVDVRLNLDSSLETIVVTGGVHYTKKRWFAGRLFTRFTNLFRKHNKNPLCR